MSSSPKMGQNYLTKHPNSIRQESPPSTSQCREFKLGWIPQLCQITHKNVMSRRLRALEEGQCNPITHDTVLSSLLIVFNTHTLFDWHTVEALWQQHYFLVKWARLCSPVASIINSCIMSSGMGSSSKIWTRAENVIKIYEGRTPFPTKDVCSQRQDISLLQAGDGRWFFVWWLMIPKSWNGLQFLTVWILSIAQENEYPAPSHRCIMYGWI